MADDDRDLFEKALASMSPADVFRGKYGAPEQAPEPAPDDPASREVVQEARELREMENAFAGVERIDRGKIRAAPPRDDLTKGEADDLRAEFEAALAAPAEVEEPIAPQVVSLAEQAGDDVHTINLRGMQPDKALSKLALFVDFASKDGHTLVRVRVGSDKGLQSVLRAWFEGAGATYAEAVEVAEEHADAAIFARIRCTVVP